MRKRVFCLMIAMGSGCAHGSVDEISDAGADDSGIFEVDPHPCDEARLLNDFWNCGECGNRCSPADAEECFGGECVCGNNPACSPGSDCRFGQCVEKDPVGGGCEFEDECPAGWACIEHHCTFVQCVPEDCDGVDNNCDGEIDNAAPGSPLSRWCFDGRVGEDVGDILLPCHAGAQFCMGDGTWSLCLGEELPVPEQGMLGCNGVDDDCDGCVDGVMSGGICESAEPAGFDIVYIIDVSGSMNSTIAAVKTATHDFSEIFSDNPEFRFGIVLVAATEAPREPYLYLDLTDFDTFETELAVMDTFGGGDEPQWDAVYELGTGELSMDWREDSTRILIVFSDEAGQSYRDPLIAEADMCGALTHGEVLAVVELPSFYGDFDDCATMFPISAHAVDMVANLETIIKDPCR